MMKKLVAVWLSLAFAVGAHAADPIIKGVFVDASSGAYLGTVIHVEQNGGNDSTGDGTESAPYATINKGLEAASTGDTVLVGPGDYTSTVDVSCMSYGKTDYTIPTVAYVNNKKVYLKSREGKATTFITGKWGSESDGTGAGSTRCVYISGDNAKGTVVEGFTIRNGAAPEHEFHASPTDGGGGISGSSDPGINNSTGKSNAPYGYAVYCTIENCRAAQGAAISCGITAISCLFRGNIGANQSKHVIYRGYNTCNCIFEGNGNGSGVVVAGSSASLSVNDTYILNDCSAQIGAASSSEPSFVYNGAFIANKSEPTGSGAGYKVQNCVTTLSGCYSTGTSCQGGASRYQVVAPAEGDYTPYTGTNGKLRDAGDQTLWAAQVTSWIPSDFAELDFYGNPRIVGGQIDVGAVERQDATTDSDCIIQLDDTRTKVKLGNVVHQASLAGEWFVQQTAPTQMYRVFAEIPSDGDVYGYSMSVDGAGAIWHYPDRASDKGFYMMPLSAAGGKLVKLSTQLAASIKYADPKLDDYTGADGSFDKPYKTIQQAINDAGTKSCGVVYAKSGTYNEGVTQSPTSCCDGQDTNSTPNRVLINKSIRVASIEGPEKTIIMGARDESATGAYDGCGPNAVRCVLASDGVDSALQGFTLTGGATDGDLANRGKWDKDPSGNPRFNSSDNAARGNFGGGGYRCGRYAATEKGVITDCIISNCVAYLGSAVYSAKVLRCIVTENHYVSHDPGVTNLANHRRVIFNGVSGTGVVGGSLVYGNDLGTGETAVSAGNIRYSTIYHLSDITDSVLSMSNTDTRKTDFVCPGAAEGDFRIKTGSGALKDAAVAVSGAVKYSTSDVYGRPILLTSNGAWSMRGAVQEAYWALSPVGDVVLSNTKPSPGETVTVTAKKGRKVTSFRAAGVELTITDSKTASYTAPAWDAVKYDGTSSTSFGMTYDSASQDWYVDAVNGNDANDGWTDGTPKKTLAAVFANDQVYSGETVYAAPGEYKEGAMSNTVNWIGNSTSNPYDPSRSNPIPSRVVVPDGVTLRSTSGNYADTKIFGQWHDSTTRQGDNAVRAVYLGKNCVLDGFTITDGATKGGGYLCEDNCGGGVVADRACNANTSYIRNCCITRCGGRSGPAGFGGIYENCKVINCDPGSDGVFYYAILKNCYINGSGGDGNQAILRSYYGVYNCTIYTTRASGDADFNGMTGATIENSIIWYYGSGIVKPTTLRNAKNCIVYPHANITIDSATCANIENTYTDITKVMDLASDCTLVKGSPAIDAGDMALYNAKFGVGTRDLSGKARISNDIVDIGAYEYEWKPTVSVSSTGTGTTTPADGTEGTVGEPMTVSADSTRPVESFAVTTNGVAVALQAGARSYEWTPTKESDRLSVTVVYGTNWYVNASATDDSGNGFTAATAKKTLAAIMGCVVAGDTVHAAEGTYNEGKMKRADAFNGGAVSTIETEARVVIPAGVRLIATGARENTIIKGAKDPDHPDGTASYGFGPKALRCVEMYAGSYLKGFTLSEGRTRWNNPAVVENNYGGGILAQDNTAVVEDCTITDCRSRYAGGAEKGTFRRCIFDHCSGTSAYGGVDQGKYYNCYFDWCYDKVVGRPAALENCTIGPNNWLSDSVGSKMDGLIQDAGSIPIRNCLVLGLVSGGVTVSYVSVDSVWVEQTGISFSSMTGGSLISVSERTNVIDATTHKPIYSATSPVIDKGNNAYLGGDDDCAGDPRISNDIVDIGAYEYEWKPTVSVSSTGSGTTTPADGTEGTVGEPMTVSADSTRPVESFAVTTNGVAIELNGATTYEWTPTKESDRLSVMVVYGTNWYVNASATDDSGNGFTAATAKKTLAAIMGCVVAGDTVHAAEGTYNEGKMKRTVAFNGGALSTIETEARVVIPAGVRLIATGARENTIIKGAKDPDHPDGTASYGFGPKALRCVEMYAGSYLKGFTLSEGRTRWNNPAVVENNYGGGILAQDNTAVVEDCMITNCCSRYAGGALNGTFRRCIFDHCIGTTSDGGVKSGAYYNCYFDWCYDNVIGSPAAVENCTIGPNNWQSGNVGSKMYQLIYNPGTTPIRNCLVLGLVANDRPTSYYSDNSVWVEQTGIQFQSIIGGSLISVSERTNVIDATTHKPIYSATSPVIDKGNNAYLGGDYDCAGDPRISNDIVDIGAYEYEWKPKATIGTFGGGSVSPSGEVEITFGQSLTIEADDMTKPLVRFEITTNGVMFVLDPGVRSFTWTPTKPSDTLTATAVYSASLYVNAVSGNDDNDGSSPELAKRTLRAAMLTGGGLAAGMTVYAAEGNYNEGVMTNTWNNAGLGSSDAQKQILPSRVVIPPGVRLVATGSKANTTITGRWHSETVRQGDNALRAVYMGAGSVLEGFTVTDGSTFNFGGGAFEGNAGGSVCAPKYDAANPAIIRNCNITRGGGRNAAGVYGGLIDHCQITGCLAGSDGACSYYSRIENSVLNGESKAAVEYFYGIYNSIVYSTGCSTGWDRDLNPVNDSAAVENSIIFPGTASAIIQQQSVLKNVKNCIFRAANGVVGTKAAVLIDNATSSNVIINNDINSVLDINTSKLFEGSPAVDAGDNALLNHLVGDKTRDLDGKARISNERVDIGPYEYEWKPKVLVSTTGTGTTTPTNGTEGTVGEPMTVSADSTRPVESFAVTTNGVAVALQAGARSYEWTPTKESDRLSVTVVYGTNWYVNASATDDSENGFTAATAKKTLAAIMGCVVAGDTVHAAPGEYNAGSAKHPDVIAGGAIVNHSRVVIPAGVSLVADSSAADTIIRGWKDPDSPSYSAKYFGCGPNSIRGVTMYGNTLLKGFTVCDCATDWNLTLVKDNHYAAGIFCADNTAVVEDCVVSNCHARYVGGVYKGSLRRCKILRCGASSGWGGVYNGEYRDCYFDDCFDQVIASPSVVENCTIGPNCYLWHTDGSKMNRLLDGNCTLKNCVILSSQTQTQSNHCFINCRILKDNEGKLTPGAGSSGNEFLTLDEMCVDGEGRPLAGSPLIDAGDSSLRSGNVSNKDVEGKARISNDIVDIGAYEYVWKPKATIGTFGGGSVSPSGEVEVVLGESLTITANDMTKPLLRFEITTNGVMFVLSPGERNFTWTPTKVSDTLTATAIYSTSMYVNAITGDDENDGSTPELAKRTLRAAMTTPGIGAGMTVYAAPGNYNDGEMTNTWNNIGVGSSDAQKKLLPSRVVIPAGVSLISTGGAEVTKISGSWHDSTTRQGENAMRAVYMGAGSVLEGFTVIYGSTPFVVGGVFEINAGGSVCAPRYDATNPAIIRNCIITEGGARNAAGVYGGFIDHCQITRCAVSSDGTCSLYSRIENSILDGNGAAAVEYFYGIYNSTVYSAGCSFGSDKDLNAAVSSAAIENSIIFPGTASSEIAYPSVLRNVKNCIFRAANGKVGTKAAVMIDDATSSNVITNNDIDAVLDGWTPFAGSPAVDAGDNALLAHLLGDRATDAELKARISNNIVDIGACEMDWMPVYSLELNRKGWAKVTAITGDVMSSDGRLTLGSGAVVTVTVQESVPAEALAVCATVAGSGRLAVKLNGAAAGQIVASGREVDFNSLKAGDVVTLTCEGSNTTVTLVGMRLAGGFFFVVQ